MTVRLNGLTLGLLIATSGVLALLTPEAWELEESAGLYWLFQLRGPVQAPSEVVVVAIDQLSAEHLQFPSKPNEWPRNVHARLIEALVKARAQVITFDLTFSTPSRIPQYDVELARAMRTAQNVVLVESLKRVEAMPPAGGAHPLSQIVFLDESVPPIPIIAEAALARAPFLLPKTSRVNEYWTFKSGAQNSPALPTLPVVTFQIYALQVYDEFVALLRTVGPSYAAALPANKDAVIRSADIPELIVTLRDMFEKEPRIAREMLRELENTSDRELELRKKRIITSLLNFYLGEDTNYLNFYGPPRSIQTLPYYQVLLGADAATSGEAPSVSDLSGKAVFVGFSAATPAEQDRIRDDYRTVFSAVTGLDISGVEIAATAFANLLEDRPIKPLPLAGSLGLVLLWGLLVGAVCRMLPVSTAAALSIALISIYVFIAHHFFKTVGVWLPLVVPLFLQAPLALFSGVLLRYRDTKRDRERLKDGASRYLPERVIDEILHSVGPVTSHHQLVYGVCLSTDGEQYTALAEKMDPQKLSLLMNEYYAVLFGPIKQHGGIVSDVVGDAMLAIWAASAPDPALRNRACAACLDMVAALEVFNQSDDRPPLNTRFGLHSGEMLLGSIGAAQHFEYRAIGDMVNTASRIQGLNKYLNTRLILSSDVAEGLVGFVIRPLGSFVLAGKSSPARMFELVSRVQHASEQQLWLCERFAGAVAAYEAQQWREACAAFSHILEAFPEDGPAKFYHKLCGDYVTAPPASPWSPAVRMHEK